jgi:hypothetical protein
MRTSLIRAFAAGALVLFAVYLYAPFDATFLLSPTEPDVSIGLDRVSNAFSLDIFATIITPLTWMPPGPKRWQNLQSLWDDALRDVLLVVGYISLAQLPLLSSRHIAVRPLACWILIALFLACAAIAVYENLEFVATQSSPFHSFYRGGYLCFGAWLPPVLFAFAAVATFMRRKGFL